MTRARPGARPRRALLDPLREFLRTEVAGGLFLAIAAAVALVWANSPASGAYEDLWSRTLTVGVGAASITEDLQHWVNDGLMAIFFFVVGLEIKRELAAGELREPKAALLPVLAAVSGVIVPAVIFLGFTWGTPAVPGWGVPMATDIAFTVGVIALLGTRVPAGAKLFLLTIATVDDVIAITVIAVAYSSGISSTWLAAAIAGLLLVVGMREIGVTAIWPYIPVGIAIWVSMLESGIHATIAGVALGLLTPAQPQGGRDVIRLLEHRLHPVSAYIIVPLFALANAGVEFNLDALTDSTSARLAIGVAVALLVGKTLGIAVSTLVATRLGLGILPSGVTTRYVWGLGALAGIGFTVSIFIAEIAYNSVELTDTAKVGILAGSLASALIGSAILFPGHPGDDDDVGSGRPEWEPRDV